MQGEVKQLKVGHVSVEHVFNYIYVYLVITAYILEINS